MPKITDVSDDDLLIAVAAVSEHGTIAAAAVALDMPRTTLSHRVQMAHRRGLAGSLGGPASPGFLITRKSPLFNANGEKIAEWRREVPDDVGHSIEAIKEAFAEYEGRSAYIPPPPLDPEGADRLTVYPIVDHHLGLLAWGQETGDDYDLSIGQALLMRTFKQVIDASPPADTGVVLSLGDFFHADNDEQRTRRSGHKQSVDGRHGKILMVGVKLMIYAIELALEKHPNVIFRAIKGNHDPDATDALRLAIWAYFHNNPRVTVDMSPSPFWIFPWGTTLLSAAHGDMVKPVNFPGMVAAKWPQYWGNTVYRYALFGHVHHKSIGGGELYGMIWETLNTLAAKDEFNSGSGYVSVRNMISISYTREAGEEGRVIRNIRPN